MARYLASRVMVIVLTIGALGAFGSNQSLAAVELTGRQARVTASALIQGDLSGGIVTLASDFDEVEAPAEVGAPFNKSTRPLERTASGFTATARAEQTSSFDLVSPGSNEISSIHYTAFATRNVSPPDDPTDLIYPAPSASSTFSAQFTVDVETPYTLTGSTTGNGDWSAEISFLRGGVFRIFPPEAPFDWSGMLSPGQYEISVSNAASPEGSGTNTGELNFTLTFGGSSALFWAEPGGGEFSVGSNWEPEAIPGAGDTAFVELPGSYNIILSEDAVVEEFNVLGGSQSEVAKPTLALVGRTLDVEQQINVDVDGHLNVNGIVHG